MKVREDLQAADLSAAIARFWDLSGAKLKSIRDTYDRNLGSPVFTAKGHYTSRGWTEWTQGFEFGSEILQYDATDDEAFLDAARRSTVDVMASHVTHIGVHDHGFNNVSTYGNLLRLAREERFEASEWETNFYELALKCSGAVQATRWTRTADEKGFIYSFNGPHSLFADTVRSLRALAVSHQLGHLLMGENDQPISLLKRLIHHADVTAKFTVYYGKGRDAYDVSGRVAHESLFNSNDGNFRAPNSQQGYAPFSTWTRGLAWVMLGFAEELEFLETVPDAELVPFGGRASVKDRFLKAAVATCDFYLENTAEDGIPYWDTGAPGLTKMGDYLNRPSEPFNEHEPVDSSAAAIAAQGLLRLGRYLGDAGTRYWQAGLTVIDTLLSEPYLSTNESHQGIILHSVYHRPNGWDHIAEGQQVPNGESSMWGDYHAREAVLYVQRVAEDKPYLKFFL